MPPQWEKLCITRILFLFGYSSLIIADIACDTWRTSVCDKVGIENRGGGGGSNLGQHRSCLPFEMVGGKYSWVDVLVYIDIWTNIYDFGDGRINVINSYPSGVAKEASRCNERESTYGVVDTESGSEEIGDCTDSGSE